MVLARNVSSFDLDCIVSQLMVFASKSSQADIDVCRTPAGIICATI